MTSSRYQSRISKADTGYYALIVRVDNDGQEAVIHGYKGRHFVTKNAAEKSTATYLAKIEKQNKEQIAGAKAAGKAVRSAINKTEKERIAAGRNAGFIPRTSNPAPRIGAAKPRRKSQVTGEKPSMRLVQRREKNTRKGYYPNPIKGGMRYLVSASMTGKQGVNPDGTRAWYAVAAFIESHDAKDYAKRLAEQHPLWSVKVDQES